MKEKVAVQETWPVSTFRVSSVRGVTLKRAPKKVQCRKEEVDAYLNGVHLLQSSDPHLRMRAIVPLVSYRPFPEWTFFLKGNHPRQSIFEWILSKKVLRLRMSVSENLLLLVLWKTEEEGQAIEKVSLIEKLNLPTLFPLNLVEEAFEYLQNVAGSTLGSFQPKVILHRVWSPQRIKEPARIGVGYKDRGSISDLPRMEASETAVDAPKAKSSLLLAIDSFSEYLQR